MKGVFTVDVFCYEAFAEEAHEEKAPQSAAQVEHFLKKREPSSGRCCNKLTLIMKMTPYALFLQSFPNA